MAKNNSNLKNFKQLLVAGKKIFRYKAPFKMVQNSIVLSAYHTIYFNVAKC